MAITDPELDLQKDPKTFPLPGWEKGTTEILSWRRSERAMWFYVDIFEAAITPDCRTVGKNPDFPADNDRLLREKVVQVLQTMEGYGRNDAPAGRQDAYARLLGLWGETEAGGGNINGWKSSCSMNESSCGLAVRTFWRLLGCRHERLAPPYEPKHPKAVLVALPHIANQVGALWPPLAKQCTEKQVLHWPIMTKVTQFLGCRPQKGDVVYIYDEKTRRQHIFTITDHTIEETDLVGSIAIEHDDGKRYIHRFSSIDGGQSGAGGDVSCCSIKAVNRTLESDLTFSGDDRKIQYIIKIDRMVRVVETPFTAAIIELICKLPRQAKVPQQDDSISQPAE